MQAVTITQITYEELEVLIEKSIKKFLSEASSQPQPEQDQWFDIDELCDYDPNKRTKATYYGLVHERKIPFHKSGKKLIFLKSEIDEWLKKGRVKTRDEIKSEAGTYIKNNIIYDRA